MGSWKSSSSIRDMHSFHLLYLQLLSLYIRLYLECLQLRVIENCPQHHAWRCNLVAIKKHEEKICIFFSTNRFSDANYLFYGPRLTLPEQGSQEVTIWSPSPIYPKPSISCLTLVCCVRFQGLVFIGAPGRSFSFLLLPQVTRQCEKRSSEWTSCCGAWTSEFIIWCTGLFPKGIQQDVSGWPVWWLVLFAVLKSKLALIACLMSRKGVLNFSRFLVVNLSNGGRTATTVMNATVGLTTEI